MHTFFEKLLATLIGTVVFALLFALAFFSLPMCRLYRGGYHQLTARVRIKFCRLHHPIRDAAEYILGKRLVFLSSDPYCVYISATDYELCYPVHMRPMSTEQADQLAQGVEVTLQLKRLLCNGFGDYGPAKVLAVRAINEPPEWDK